MGEIWEESHPIENTKRKSLYLRCNQDGSRKRDHQKEDKSEGESYPNTKKALEHTSFLMFSQGNATATSRYIGRSTKKKHKFVTGQTKGHGRFRNVYTVENN